MKHQCYKSCVSYYNSKDGMECHHPYFDDKPVYENQIITIFNSMDGNVPEKCPLRNGIYGTAYFSEPPTTNNKIFESLIF